MIFHIQISLRKAKKDFIRKEDEKWTGKVQQQMKVSHKLWSLLERIQAVEGITLSGTVANMDKKVRPSCRNGDVDVTTYGI